MTALFCYEEYNCTNISAAANFGGWLDCSRYKSCWENLLINNSNGYSNFFGGWSSHDTNEIISVDVGCGGSRSCDNVNNMHIVTANWSERSQVMCAGLNACVNTNVNGTGLDDIFCDGESSCKHTTMNNMKGIGFYGAYSGIGSKINTDTTTTITDIWIGFYGYYSGYNATVYCWDGQDCFIDCDGNACFGLTVLCQNGFYDHCFVDCNNKAGNE